MEEYLNNLKALIEYNCIHYIVDSVVYLEVLSSKKLSKQEFNHIKDILKTWKFMSNTNTISYPKRTHIYSFIHENLMQEIRNANLKELI